MTICRFYLLVGFLLLGCSAISQSRQESGIWLGFDVSKDLKKGFDIGAEANLRLDQGATSLGAAILDITLKKKWSDYLRTSLTYRNSEKWDEFGQIYGGRWALDNRLEHVVGRFEFDYRLRYQVDQGLRFEEMGWHSGAQALRHRLGATVDLPKKWWASASYERFTEPYTDGLLYSSAWRMRLSAEKQIKKRKSISIGYQVERDLTQSDTPTEYILMLGFSLELKKRKKTSDKEKTPVD